MKKYQRIYSNHGLSGSMIYVRVPHSVVGAGLTKVILRGFADASKLAISVAVYALAIHTSAPVQQNLLVGKSRIAQREQLRFPMNLNIQLRF